MFKRLIELERETGEQVIVPDLRSSGEDAGFLLDAGPSQEVRSAAAGEVLPTGINSDEDLQIAIGLAEGITAMRRELVETWVHGDLQGRVREDEDHPLHNYYESALDDVLAAASRVARGEYADQSVSDDVVEIKDPLSRYVARRCRQCGVSSYKHLPTRCVACQRVGFIETARGGAPCSRQR